jgi:hypothetical protein
MNEGSKVILLPFLLGVPPEAFPCGYGCSAAPIEEADHLKRNDLGTFLTTTCSPPLRYPFNARPHAGGNLATTGAT